MHKTAATEGNLFTAEGMQQLGSYCRNVREFKGYSRRQVAEKTGISKQWLTKFELATYNQVPKKETLSTYCDFLGIALELQYHYKINNKMKEGNNMEQVRIELDQFDGSKRKQLEKAVNEALKDLQLYSDSYFNNEFNEIDSFQQHLASEAVSDTQAVVVTVGSPDIVQYDYDDAILSDSEAGPEGGYERVVRKFVINDLEKAPVTILLTFDI